MKKFKSGSWLFLSIAVILLAACGKKDEPILPFSSLVPGVTAAEAQAAEPGEAESDTVFIVKKDYNGIPLSAVIDDSRPGNGVIWNCYEEDGDLDKLISDIRKYCDKRYKLVEENERNGSVNVLWEAGEYSIFMQDFTKGDKRQVDISVLR